MQDKSIYRIIYMGTPEISANTFEALIKSGWNFVALIAQVDKEVGRKRILEEVPTKKVAKKYNIPVYQPTKIRDDYEFIKELKPDLILTFAYGQIIPQGLLDIPKYGCLNLHGSLLPKYRGAAPIQRAIINGDTITGITLMEMIDKMDAGRMYKKEYVDITEDDNYTSLSNKLSLAATKVVNENLLKYFSNDLKGEFQDNSLVTFADKIKSENEHIDINASMIDQVNLIRALSYTPGAYLMLGNEKLKIYKAKMYSNRVHTNIGGICIENKHVLYQCKDGLIELLEIQPQGKNKMNAIDFYNGHKDIINKVLS